eukprot:3073242-Rhodomonas_salina.1
MKIETTWQFPDRAEGNTSILTQVLRMFFAISQMFFVESTLLDANSALSEELKICDAYILRHNSHVMRKIQRE